MRGLLRFTIFLLAALPLADCSPVPIPLTGGSYAGNAAVKADCQLETHPDTAERPTLLEDIATLLNFPAYMIQVEVVTVGTLVWTVGDGLFNVVALPFRAAPSKASDHEDERAPDQVI